MGKTELFSCISAEEMLAYVAYKWSRIARVVVRLYPTYLCRRDRMKILYTLERRIFQRALSVRSYSFKSEEVVTKA